MKKMEEIKIMEADALGEITGHVETLLNCLDTYQEYTNGKKYRLIKKTRKILGKLWDWFENDIISIYEADDRVNKREF